MPAGSHEMRDFFSNQDPPRSAPHTAPSITPYLGLRARLSQIWINRWTILLLLVLARTLIALSGINHDLSSARREALSACSDVESMGSAMASMPHYMSQGVNELTAKGVEKSVHGLMAMSTLSVTAVEEIVLFVIGMMTNTYLCLITLAVSGSLHAVIGVLDSAQADLKKLTSGLGDDLGNVVGDFEKAYTDILDQLSKVSVLSVTKEAPTLNLTKQIDSLRNLKLPDDLDADLQKLNKSIPTFAEVQNVTESLIRLPFEEVKKLINESLGTYTFDRSIFPVPEKQLLTFCSDNDGINSFFDKLVDLSEMAKKVFIGTLLTAAILVMIPMAWREIKRWRSMQQRSQLVGSGEREPMDVVYIVSRPYTSTAGLKLAKNLDSARRQVLVRWVIAYATSDAALFVLALAIAGLFSCACQAILLKGLEKEVPSLTNQVGAFADKVVLQLNNASEQWAVGTNAAVANLSDGINTDMLGWVGTATDALNETINMFINMTTDVLNTTFGGTPLYDPILEVLDCLVLMKAHGIQEAITWVHDNAHVNFPTLPNNTFSLGAAASLASDSSSPDDSFLSTPGDLASDKISSVVAGFIDRVEETIRTEALISTAVLLVWLLVVFIGIGRALTLWFGRDRNRGEGGAVVPVQYPAPGNSDFRSDNQDRYAAGFADIPLGTVNHPRPYTPAPRYTEAKEASVNVSPESHPDDPFQDQDQKFGFAGQRGEYERNDASRRIRSVRASIWPSDNKI
jgi:hypothetical protein